MNTQYRALRASLQRGCLASLFAGALLASSANAIQIVGEFIGDGDPFDPAGMAAGGGTIPFGGAAPGSVAGGGSFADIFDAAASWWEQAILDEHTVTIQYGWGPRGDSGVLATAFSIPTSPQPAVYGKILIDNDGSSSFFLDSTPADNSEFPSFASFTDDLGGGTVNTGRVYSGGAGAAASTDLLTVFKHEIGHILGINGLAPDWGTITAPRPFAGTVIPKVDSAHFDDDPMSMTSLTGDPLLSPTIESGVRKSLSAIDILAAAQHGGWSMLDLDPDYEPDFMAGPSHAVESIGLVEVSGDWDLTVESFEGFAHHGLPTLLLEEEAVSSPVFELAIEVTMAEPGGSALFAIDKVVKNFSGEDWDTFEMELGTIGEMGEFIPSGPGDGLMFITTPAPDEETGLFTGMPEFDDIMDPNSLGYVEGTHFDGAAALYWLGLSIDDDIDGVLDGKATFILRQRAPLAIPEPSTLLCLPCLLLGGLSWRRRSNLSVNRIAY